MSRILMASLMLTAAPAALAQEEMTQLGAHVHGIGELALAMDPTSGELAIEMSGPAYNVYGFERAPRNEEETARVDAAHAGLLAGDQFIFAPAAGCTWIDTEIFGGPVIGDEHDHGHDHDHGDHDHGHDHDEHDHGDHHDHGHDDHGHDHHDDEHSHDDHGHDDHGHDDHDHNHEDHAHGEEHSHSDMLVRWRFTCEVPSAFDRVDATGLFDVLPSLTTLNVQFFDGSRADAGELTRDRRALVID